MKTNRTLRNSLILLFTFGLLPGLTAQASTSVPICVVLANGIATAPSVASVRQKTSIAQINRSIVALLEHGLQVRFFSLVEVQTVSQNGLNTLEQVLKIKSTDTATLPIQQALVQLLEALKESHIPPQAIDKNLKNSIAVMLNKQQSQLQEQETAQENTRTIYNPRVVTEIPTLGKIYTSPKFHLAKDGRELLAFGSTDGNLYLADLKNPLGAITIPAGAWIYDSVVFHRTKDGRDLVFFSSYNGKLIIVDVERPDQPQVISARDATAPAFYESPDGRELFVFGTADGLFYGDLKEPLKTRNLLTRNTVSKTPIHHKTKSGRDLLIFSDYLGDLFVMDINNSSANLRLPKEVATPLSVYQTKDGRDLAVYGSKDYSIHIIDLDNPYTASKIYSPNPSVNPHNRFTAFNFLRTKDGRELMTFGEIREGLFIVDLAPVLSRANNRIIKNYQLLKSIFGLSSVAATFVLPNISVHIPTSVSKSSPIFYSTIEGWELLAFGSHNNGLFIADVNSVEAPLKIDVSGSVDSTPAFYRTREGRELLAFGAFDGKLRIVELFQKGSRGSGRK